MLTNYLRSTEGSIRPPTSAKINEKEEILRQEKNGACKRMVFQTTTITTAGSYGCSVESGSHRFSGRRAQEPNKQRSKHILRGAMHMDPEGRGGGHTDTEGTSPYG